MKKILSSLTALILAAALTVPAMAANLGFQDVPSDHWAYNYIQKAADNEWVAGTGNDLYAPNNNVTVAQWITMVVRAAYPEKCKQPVKPGQWYSDKWYGRYVEIAIEENLDYFEPENLFVLEHMDRPMTRAEMACLAGSVLVMNGFVLDGNQMKEIGQKIPAFAVINEPNDRGLSYGGGVGTVYYFGVISGVDQTGRFDPFAKMNRAQAAAVLCRMMDVLATKGENKPDVKPDFKPEDLAPQPQPQPEPKPEQPTADYGPVGTVSSTPVKLSYETHKPVTDYWAQNSDQFKANVDRDTYNAAIQSMKDWEAAGDRNGQVGRTKANMYYNYAVFNMPDEAKRTVGAIEDTGIASAFMLGSDYKENAIWLSASNFKSRTGYKHFSSYIDQITPSMSDKEVAEICMKAITDNWTYGPGDGSWRNGEFVGQCGELATAYQQVMRAANIPCIYTATSEHAWTYVRLDGQWYIADPTLAVHMSDAGNEVYTADWLWNLNDPMQDHLFDGHEAMKLEYEGSSANIAMHFIEQSGYGR